MGKGKNLISGVTTLLDSSVHFLKMAKHTKKINRKVWLSQKKKNKSTETAPEKTLTTDLLDKDFKTTVLKMLKELKEDREEVKKMICEQNGNVSKEREYLKINQKEIHELKITITGMKTLLE